MKSKKYCLELSEKDIAVIMNELDYERDIYSNCVIGEAIENGESKAEIKKLERHLADVLRVMDNIMKELEKN